MKSIRPVIDSLLQTYVLLFLILFVVLVGSGVEVLTANASDFSSALGYTLAVLLGLSLIIPFLAVIPVLILPNPARETINFLLLLLTCLIWLQSTVFVWDYGFLDGSELLWGQNLYRGLFECVVWLLLTTLAIVKRASLIGRWKTIASLVLLSTFLSASITSIRRASAFDLPTYVISDTNKFSFSKDQNIIYFLLDGFQSDVFQYLLDSNPTFQEEFTGFTFYRNTASAFAKTAPTIPLLLTGDRYENDVPLDEFIRRSFAAGSVPQSLLEAGWDVGLFPLVPRTVPVDGSIASNFVRDVGLRNVFDDALTATDISLFRAVPHFIKPHVYNEGNWIAQNSIALQALVNVAVLQWSGKLASLPRTHIHPEIDFLNHMEANVNVSNVKPVFRFFHHYMPHAPFVLDRELNLGELSGSTEEAYYEYSLASIRLLLEYFDLLKRELVFGGATIIVSSDHGGGDYSSAVYRPGQGWRNDALSGGLEGAHAASGRALLLIKEEGASQDMTTSDKPISLGDIASTIARYAGLERSFGGTPVQDLRDDAVRERLYSYYTFDGSTEYLSDGVVTEYLISDHVWQAESWTKIGVSLGHVSETGVEEKFAFGTLVRFGREEENLYLSSGWSSPEPGFVWSEGKEAKLMVPLAQPPDVNAWYAVTLEGIPFVIEEQLPYQLLELSVGSYSIETTMSEPGKAELLIPGQALTENPAVFTVGLPLARSPFSLRRSYDQRELGFGLRSLGIQESTFVPLRCGQPLDFSSTDDFSGIVARGLSEFEEWGRWTDGGLSSIEFLLEAGDCTGGELSVRAMGFVNELNSRVASEIQLNGVGLGRCVFDNLEGKGPKECAFRVPEDLLVLGGLNTVEFRNEGIGSPRELGFSGDGRMLGLGLIELLIQ